MQVEIYLASDGRISFSPFPEATEARTTFLGKGFSHDGEHVFAPDGTSHVLEWDGVAFRLKKPNGDRSAQLHVSGIRKL